MKRLRGSDKVLDPGSRLVGEADPEHPMSVVLVLRRRAPLVRSAKALSRSEFAERFGADPADIARVERFAADRRLTVIDVHPGARTVTLRGTTAAMQTAFDVRLQLFATAADERFRGRTGEVSIPDDLEGIVLAVFGLDDRPAARPHLRWRPSVATAPRLGVKAKGAKPVPLTVPQVSQLYEFPPKLDGSGQCIAIIELGGGYRPADLDRYFSGIGVTKPPVTAVGVAGAHNQPGVDKDADGEVTLDVEVAGGVAPKAAVAVYFAPNTDAGFLQAIKSAVHDSLRKPSVISISWGSAEERWTAASRTEFDAAFEEAAALGVTVLAAAGDDGSSDGVSDGNVHVDFPASSPRVVGCGGTRLIATDAGSIAAESVWNDGPDGPGAGGGGVSRFFPLPAYQKSSGVPSSDSKNGGRGVPDISGNADPMSGYIVVIDGLKNVIGGTSAVAPLYAGLVARINQARAAAGLTPLGQCHDSLYATAALFRDVVAGNNDYEGSLRNYAAGKGWDAATGLGSAIGSAWAQMLGAVPKSAAPKKRNARQAMQG